MGGKINIMRVLAILMVSTILANTAETKPTVDDKPPLKGNGNNIKINKLKDGNYLVLKKKIYETLVLIISFSDRVKQFLKNVLDVQPDLNLDICYQDSVITCSCPDGWYCCVHGDPSCTGTCCPAGTSCGGPRGPCY